MEDDIPETIKKAQEGDQVAKNKIIKLMQDNKYMCVISRYLYANRLLEPDDVRSEFWMGVILALPKVDTKKGDPLFYLAWSGANRVKTELRNKIGRGVIMMCIDCGYIGRLYRKKREYRCKKCDSLNIDSWQKEINNTTLTANLKDGDNFLDLCAKTRHEYSKIDIIVDIQQFKKKLSPRELTIFVLMTEKYINRYYEKNYIKTIAEMLKITPQAIVQYLKKIKKKMAGWF